MHEEEIKTAVLQLTQIICRSQIRHDDLAFEPLALRDDSGRDDAMTLTFEMDRDPEMDRLMYESFGFDMGRTRGPEGKEN
jgi:hypothetical protein